MVFRKTNTWNQILSLAAYADGRLHPCGTAFLVGKGGLAITAAHVLGQPFDRRIVDINRLGPQGFPVIALQVINRGEKTLQWRVVSMNRVPSLSYDADRPLDIAFLTLQPCGDLVPEIEDHRRFFFQLNIATPHVGMPVAGYGFSNARLEQNPDEPFEFALTQSFRRVDTKVTSIHFPMRDQACMPYPCFEVDAVFEPGMSGGPIFNERDEVCGVISRGSDFGVSWASIFWPALVISINGKTGYQLAREGSMAIRNLQCVQIRRVPGNDFPTIHFDPKLEKK
jgi:hypothetical protein